MSSIFASPELSPKSGILFLHGLEGSVNGSKAMHLKDKWGANCPSLRTDLIRELSLSKGMKGWRDLDSEDIEEALEPVYQDAVQAVRYSEPSTIIGSSMGGAILYKMAMEGIFDKDKVSCIFLAPAIHELIHSVFEKSPIKNSFWIFGESDTVISNKENLKIALSSSGNIVFSQTDNHRLSKALESGIIDSGIVTTMELSLAL